MSGSVSTSTDSALAAAFARDGYVVVRGLCDEATRTHMRDLIERSLAPLIAPAEFEADVGYPGSPASRTDAGGETPRRLLNAISRDAVFRDWATGPLVGRQLAALWQRNDIVLSQCHHNCIMTKYPGFSSATLWHQDIRYWSFDRPELISGWTALGTEDRRNGALKVIPGSHALAIDRGRLDADLFLRPELKENKALIRESVEVDLAPGDVLFFHCRLYHAAGKNLSTQVKLSCVFSYHTSDNEPIPGTRSSVYQGLDVNPGQK